ARRHRGVAVDISHAARRRDMAQLRDVMLVVAERDEIEIAFRRLAALKTVEAFVRQHLVDRAQPVGAFRMSWRRDVIEACRMGQKQRGHGLPGRAMTEASSRSHDGSSLTFRKTGTHFSGSCPRDKPLIQW